MSTRAREIAELGQNLSVDASGNLGFSGDLELGDNNKAVFGAGSDLQIYHDGSNSYIQDAATGSLILKSNNILLTSPSGESMMQIAQNDFVKLFHDNAVKMQTTSTGIDITGIADASTLFRFGVDNSEIANNYLRFKPSGGAYIDHSTVGQDINFRVSNASSLDTTPLVVSSTGIDVTGTVTADGLTVDGIATLNAVDPYVRFNASTSVDYNIGASSAGGFYIYDVTNSATRLFADDNGDISFYEDTGTTPKFFWDASLEALGVGITPSTAMHIYSGSGNTALRVETGLTNGQAEINFKNDARRYNVGINSSDNLHFVDDTAGATRMTIDSSGRVGIGTSSPSRLLSIDSGASTNGRIHFTNTSTGSGSSNGFFIGQDSGDGKVSLWSFENDYMRFATNNSEAMRIDASGNLLVGTTNTSLFNNNTDETGFSYKPGGSAVVSRVNGTCLFLNRQNSDGDIAQFRKDGSTVGSIGVNSSDQLYISRASGSQGIKFKNGGAVPCNANGSDSDNDQDLGISSVRWDDIYATNGTIQTSDRNEKQDIEALSDAEQRVAVACKGLLRKFRWKDAVAEKGDDARIHFGIIAQDLQDAFTAEGLDAGDYAMFISSTWWETQTEVPAVEAVDEVLDEDGNVVTEAVEAKEAYTRTDTYETLEEAPEGATERTRLGVRYPELLAFIIAAI